LDVHFVVGTRFYNNAVKIFGKLALGCRRFGSKCSFMQNDHLTTPCHSALSKKVRVIAFLSKMPKVLPKILLLLLWHGFWLSTFMMQSQKAE